jgi:hypothetical protein
MLRGTDSLLYRVNLMSCENAPARGLLFWGSLIGFLTSGAVCIFMFTGNDYFRSLIWISLPGVASLCTYIFIDIVVLKPGHVC